MAHSSTSEEGNGPDHVIVKADEVDQTGTDISPVPDEQLMAEVVDGLARDQPASNRDAASNVPGGQNLGASGRSEVRREAVAPPPPLQPPPPAPSQQNAELATDSLNLAQLKRIVQDIPKLEQRAYAFEYADCQPFPEELDEWFQYSEPERMMLLGSKVSFEHHWKEFCGQKSSASGQVSWLDASSDLRKAFMERTLDELHNPDLFLRIEALEAVCYTMAGVWGVTAGRSVDDYPDVPTAKEAAETPRSKSLQIKWIENNVLLVHECSGIPTLFEYMRKVFDKDRSVKPVWMPFSFLTF